MDCMSEGKMDVGGSVEFKAVRTLRTYKMRITSVREEIYKIKIRNYHTEGRAKFLLGKPKRAEVSFRCFRSRLMEARPCPAFAW